MPLFRSSPPPPPPPPPPAEPASRSRSLFSRRPESPEYAPSTTTESTRSGRSGGFFSRRRSTSSDTDTGTNNGSGSLDLRNDRSIIAARNKVTDAEAAERAADEALMQARAAVRGAREHVKLLERDALEQYVILQIRIVASVSDHWLLDRELPKQGRLRS